jgi:TolB-like protein
MRFTLALLLVVLASVASAAPRAKVAVMEVKNVQGVPEGTATILTDIVVSEVARYGFEVVSKADIAAIVGFEKQKALLGCSDDSSCLAEIGGALGVDYMLTGTVGQIGSRYRISLILVDVKKGKVAGRAADFCDKNEDALANAALSRVREIIAAIQAATSGEKPAVAGQPGATGAPPPVLAAKPPPPALQAAPLALRADAPSSPGASWSRRKILGVSLTGGGGLMLVGGVAMGLRAKRLDSDLAAAKNDLGYYFDYPAKRDQVRRTALIADVLYGLGAVSAGVGGYLWFTDRPAAVAVLPVVGDGLTGVVAMGRF